MNKQIHSLTDFRQALQNAMELKGLTQPELAEITGVSQSSLSLFLTKKRGLSGKAVLKLWPFVYEQGTTTSKSTPTADSQHKLEHS